MITQLITLIAVLIGAAASYFATTSIERARHKRALETRWDERKLNAYIDYGSAVKAVNIAAKKVFAVHDQLEMLPVPLAEMEEAEVNRSTMFEALILLAESSAVDVAHTVNQRLWRILGMVRNPADADDVDLERLGIELMSALTDLHERARLDLGITGQLRRVGVPRLAP